MSGEIRVSVYNPQSGTTTVEIYDSVEEFSGLMDRWLQLGLVVVVQSCGTPIFNLEDVA